MNEELFDWSNCVRKKESGAIVRTKKSIEWRAALPTREVKKVDQVIVEAVLNEKTEELELHYYMANDREAVIQPPYKVPKEQMGFINDAVLEGVLTYNKPLWIEIEVDKNNYQRWIKITEK